MTVIPMILGKPRDMREAKDTWNRILRISWIPMITNIPRILRYQLHQGDEGYQGNPCY